MLLKCFNTRFYFCDEIHVLQKECYCVKWAGFVYNNDETGDVIILL